MYVNTMHHLRTNIDHMSNHVQNRKAPGLENLNAELLIADLELAAEILLPLLTTIWERSEIPTYWTEGIIV